MWNCSELDTFVSEVHDFARDNEVGAVVLAAFLCTTGSLLVFAGEQLVRPLGAVVGGVGGAWVTFVVTAMFGGDVQCELRLVAAAVVGVVGAALALFVLKTGVFLLGAGGLGAVTHLVYDSLPLPPPRDDFALLGRSGYYYIAMVAATLVGGVISYVQRKNFLRIASSMLGGGCFALAIFIVCDWYGVAFPNVAGLGVLATSTFVGVGVQLWRKNRRKSRRRRRKAPEGGVAMGVPV